jgi:glucose-6-phosphate dehydrogenase assembly protein OpcA
MAPPLNRSGSKGPDRARAAEPEPSAEHGFMRLEGNAPQPFDLAGVEAELRTMWKMSSGHAEGRAAVRAAMSNLIVPMEPERHGRVVPALVEVTRRHPSRLILVEIAREGGSRELIAEVAALCHLRTEGGYVCSEQIILRGEAPSGPVVPSAVRALLVGNLPAVLLDLRCGEPEPWILEIAERADLVLADSLLAEDAGIQRALWARIQDDPKIRDLAWVRLMPWREVLAEAFDATRLTPTLGRVTEARIDYGEASPVPAFVPLLAAWLASRLGWTLRGGDREGWLFDSVSGRVRVEAVPNHEHAGAGLERVSLRGQGALDIEVSHQGREPQACVRVHHPVAEVHDLPYTYRDFASCIVGEIHRHEANKLLQEAAALALALTESPAAT